MSGCTEEGIRFETNVNNNFFAYLSIVRYVVPYESLLPSLALSFTKIKSAGDFSGHNVAVRGRNAISRAQEGYHGSPS